ncbi:MAG: sigma-70 family RNA polymerase sigma factor [Eubacteriales bacterium]|nr:sigma-70 family RNA polymerase sigma factor [Eubacteriales bacterium]
MDAHMLDEQFASGGDDVLAEAIALYGQPLLRYCHHILCDYHDAQDAVQTTFIKAYDNRKRFRAGTSLSAWLYRLAYTTCIDALRRRKLQLFTPPPAAPDPDYIGDDLRRALETLSPEQRALVYGRVIEQRSFDALAVIYGKPAATLRKRYERARRKLAQALEGTPAERRRRGYESHT